MKNIIKNTLSEKAFFQVNKILLQYLGSHEAAIILAHYLELQENLFGGKEFYQQQERVMENCMISEYKLRNVNTLLQDLEILSIKKRGLPAKNYYYVNLDKLAEILDSTTLNNKVTSTGKTQAQRKDLILEKNNNLIDINDNIDNVNIDNDTSGLDRSIVKLKLSELSKPKLEDTSGGKINYLDQFTATFGKIGEEPKPLSRAEMSQSLFSDF